MKTKFLKVGFITTLIIFMLGGLSFCTVKITDATQADTPDCEKIKSECLPSEQNPICQNSEPPCPQYTAK